MDEEIEFILDTAKEAMNNAIAHLEKELRSIRAGKATPAMLSTVMVDYYGSQTPLSQVANVNTPDARTLSIQPWEKNMLQPRLIIIQIRFVFIRARQVVRFCILFAELTS